MIREKTSSREGNETFSEVSAEMFFCVLLVLRIVGEFEGGGSYGNEKACETEKGAE